MKVRTFRDLLIWQKGMALARQVYRSTCAMPRDELFGLTSQMRRAACSVPLNIAEGYGRRTRPEYLKGLRTAVGSLSELSTAYELATSMEMISVDNGVLEAIAEEDRMLMSVMTKLEAKTEQEEQARKKTRRRSP